MASLCYTYDVNFRNLMEAHNLGIKEGCREKVYFTLNDSSYKIRKHQDSDNAEYDKLRSNDMTNVMKVQELWLECKSLFTRNAKIRVVLLPSGR